MQSFQHLRGKSWLAVDITTGRLGYVKDPAECMGSAFFHDGKWHPISEKPSGIESRPNLHRRVPRINVSSLDAASADGDETLGKLVQNVRNNQVDGTYGSAEDAALATFD